MHYLHLTAVVRYDEAEQDERRQTDDRLQSEGVNGALWEIDTQICFYFWFTAQNYIDISQRFHLDLSPSQTLL